MIAMLREANRPVSKLELTKWAFVARMETSIGENASFYDFVPYHYGPYSFSLARELGTLADQGYVSESNNEWQLGSVTDEGTLPAGTHREARQVVARFVGRSTERLIDYVYDSYPIYTVNSRRKQLAKRPVAKPAVYTAGYEGLQVDGFLNLLVQNGIRRLIDVRNNPVARRFGFHKSTLTRLCNSLDIEYVHEPELGISSNERQSLNSAADYSTLFRRYEQATLPTRGTEIERVTELMQEKASVLVCMEADPCMCHRTRLAAVVEKKAGLPVVHLKAE
ncbi:MAG: DUF488 domain-containing protein [Planctomycetales bacterium]|nr:DUF488 domain-containing protein [Planctomycetales bacterium]MBN8627731.1 DUF488 domain-containing protein [Planctomycetota bacterium]